MKFLFRSPMLMLLALMISFTSQAQSNESPVAPEELTASLDLRPDQSAQFEELRLRYAEKKMGIKKTTPNAEEAATKIKELKASYLKELSAILTPEQLEKWKAMQPQEGK